MSRETLVPSIPDIRDDNLKDILRAIKSMVDVREGKVGDPLDQNVTLRDLTSIGLLVNGGSSTISGGSNVPVSIPGSGGNGYNPTTDYTVPPAPKNLTAVGGFANVYLGWDGAPYSNHAYTEIWRNSTDNLGTAVKVGTTVSSVYADPAQEGSTYYYWVRFVSQANIIGPYNSTKGTSATTSTDPTVLLDVLAGQITESQLYHTLGSRIDLIDAPATTDGSVAARIAAETAARTTAIAAEATARANAITAEANARTAAIADEASQRTTAIQAEASTRASDILAEVNARASAISAEAILRSAGDQSEASTRAQAIADEQSARAAAVLAEAQARANAISDEAAARQAAITTETTARQNADSSLASSITTLTASLNTANSTLTAAIQAEQTARTSAVSAEATARQTLATQLTGGYSGTDPTQLSTGLIYSERQSRITSEGNLQSQINLLNAASSGDYQSLIASVQSEQTARVAGDQANASNISLLTARLDNLKDGSGTSTNKTIEATIADNKAAQVSSDQALSTSISTLTSTVTGNYNSLSSAIQSEATTRATAITSEATSRDSLATQLRGSYSGTDVAQLSQGLIYSERVSRVSADSSLQSQITSLSATVNTNNTSQTAAVQAEQTARIAADSAEATSRETLATQLRGSYSGTDPTQLSTGILYTERQARISAEGTLTSNLSALSSTVTNNYNTLNSAISSEATTRANSDSAMSTSITGLTATVGTKARTFWAATAPTATATGDIWFDTANNNRAKRWDGTAWIDATDTRITLNAAAITSEQTARADADSALTTSINQLTTTVSNNYSTLNSAITSEATTRSTADTTLTNSINSLTSTVTGNYSTLNAAITSEASTRASADTAFSSSLSSLTSTVNTKNQTFYQSTQPTAGSVGDLWFDTGNGNLAKRWSGTAWVATDDTRIATNTAAITSEASTRATADTTLTNSINTLSSTVTGNYNTLNASIQSEASTRATADTALSTSISTVSAVASAKNKSYFQAAAPASGMTSGDLWYDSDDNNKLYRYDGTAWTAVDDLRIAANAAAITTETNARISADSSLATQITTLTSTVNTNNTNLTSTLQNSYYTKTQTDTAISSATSTLVSTTALNTALSSYPTTATLTTNYYTKTATDSAISSATQNLVSTTGLTTALGNYTTTANLQNSYYTKTQTDSAISTATSTLVSQTGLNTALGAYTTTAALQTSYYTKTQTDSAISTANTTLNARLNRVVNINIKSRGAGATAGGNQVTSEDGTVLGTCGRSYMVTVFNGSTGAWISSTTYDVYGDPNASTAMANALNGIDSSRVVVVNTYDEPWNNRLTGGFEAAMYRCGASRYVFGATSPFKYRGAYILVGIPGIGEGAGIERYAGSSDNAADAYCEYQLQLVNGRPVSLGGNPLTSALQIEATTRANVDTGLLAQYTVKTDVAGLISGFGLASTAVNGVPSSSFGIRADRFWLAPPTISSPTAPTANLYVGMSWLNTSDGNTYYLTEYVPGSTTTWTSQTVANADTLASRIAPFIVQTSPTTVNGTTVPPGVYIRDAYIQNASISSAKIKDLVADKITAGTVTAAIDLRSAIVRSGNIGFGTAGFYLGADAGYNKFYIGNGSTSYLKWDGSNAYVAGTIYANAGVIGGSILDASSIRSGQTAWNTGNGFYLGSDGRMSFGTGGGNRITWDKTNLEIVSPLLTVNSGSATFSGALNAATGTFTGALSAATGTFSGALSAGVVDVSQLTGVHYEYPNAGTYSVYTMPYSGNVRFTLIGAGGGGGGGGKQYAGNAGGAGGVVTMTITNVPSGTAITVSVGYGGYGGAVSSNANSPGSGNAGESTTIYIGANAYSAGGGYAGSPVYFAPGGYPSVANNVTVLYHTNDYGDYATVASSTGYAASYAGSAGGARGGSVFGVDLAHRAAAGNPSGLNGGTGVRGGGGGGGAPSAAWVSNRGFYIDPVDGDWGDGSPTTAGGAGGPGYAFIEIFNPNSVVLKGDYDNFVQSVNDWKNVDPNVAISGWDQKWSGPDYTYGTIDLYANWGWGVYSVDYQGVEVKTVTPAPGATTIPKYVAYTVYTNDSSSTAYAFLSKVYKARFKVI